MIIYSGGDNHLSTREWLRALDFGQMKAPGSSFQPPFKKVRWVLDNGAFGLFKRKDPRTFDQAMGKPFKRLLQRIDEGSLPPVDFTVLPDIVAGGVRSLRLSQRWVKHIPESVPAYLAVQDGHSTSAVARMLPHTRLSGLFVGGTVEWKHETAAQWAILAHDHGLKCHVGRIGMGQDIYRMMTAKVDSIDSTSWARHRSYYHVLDGFELHARMHKITSPILRKMRRLPLPI